LQLDRHRQTRNPAPTITVRNLASVAASGLVRQCTVFGSRSPRFISSRIIGMYSSGTAPPTPADSISRNSSGGGSAGSGAFPLARSRSTAFMRARTRCCMSAGTDC
jgi:hypothetical protein